jgi:hypothetical protein
MKFILILGMYLCKDRSQWPRGLRWVCSSSLAGIVGSNPAGDLDIFLL